jgi:AraC-like DNA-binding protein
MIINMFVASLSLDDLTGPFAQRSGVVYKHFEVHEAERLNVQEPHVARGSVEVFTPRSGLNMVLADIETFAAVSGEAVYPAGVTLAVTLDGTPCPFGHDEKLIMTPGRCVVFRADDAVPYEGKAPKGFRGRVALLHVAQDWLEDARLIADFPDVCPQISCCMVSPAIQQALGRLYSRFRPGALRDLYAESIALGLVVEALAEESGGGLLPSLRSRDLDAAWHVRHLIERDPLGNHTLSSLARAAAISPSSVKVKFPKVFGISVVAFLRDLRLEIAYCALQQGRWSVAEAAYAIGYNHPSNFSIAFKRKYGCSPLQVASSADACVSHT